MQKSGRRLVEYPLIRVLIVWLIAVPTLLLLNWVLPGFQVEGLLAAFLAVHFIGLLNALLWPILSYLILPFAVLTLGLFSLVLNGVIVQFASRLVDGFHVANLGTAIWVSLWLTVVNLVASSLLTIDDDSSWYRNMVHRHMKRRNPDAQSDAPGILFLEIDGLAKPVLERALQQGYLPNLAQWLAQGTHRLVGWETDLSSQTSASQAGLLHGNNHDIPAFRWYDRQRQVVVASSDPDEVARLEKERSDGSGLLADHGVSRGNLFSGDAPSVMATASTVKDLSRLHIGDFYAYFADPYHFSRTLLLAIWDIILEKWQYRRARKNHVQPILDRHHRGGVYPFLRMFTTVIMRELNVYTLIGDMLAGRPVAYATFVGYDEVAHHSGVEDEGALDQLAKLDKQFGRLANASQQTPRPYHLVVLSDHGQSGGATFQQRYGMTLEELIRQLAAAITVDGGGSNESWGHLNTFLTDTVRNDSRLSGKVARWFLHSHTKDGDVVLGPEQERRPEPDSKGRPLPNIVVLASGNLGLLYVIDASQRITLEQIEERYPGLLQGLAQHEGIGFVMVHSQERGGVVIGRGGYYYLEDDRIEGENPLASFGPNAAQHLRRNDGFSNAPDIYINSFYNAETNEVAAFEELIGCHGGLGGYQAQPFLLFPAEWDLGNEPLIGAAAVYQQLKRQIALTAN